MGSNILENQMGPVKRIWYLSPIRVAMVQANLRIRAVSPEPPLLAHTSSESRGTFRKKARSLPPLNGWTCAVKICHDGMLEDTNSLDDFDVRLLVYFPVWVCVFLATQRTWYLLKWEKNKKIPAPEDQRVDPLAILYMVNSTVCQDIEKVACEYPNRHDSESKKISNDQELIQSDPISCPQNQKEK